MARYGIKDVFNITFFDSTGAPVMFMDSLKVTQIDLKAQTKYATGGSGAPRLIGWDYDKQGTMKVQDALVSMQGLQMKAATTNVDTASGQAIYKREVLTVGATAGTVTLSQTPIANSLTVISNATSDDGYTNDATLTKVASAPTAGEYSIATDTITLDSSTFTTGKKVIVYYQFAATNPATTVTITSADFPGYYKIVGDVKVRNENGTDENMQMIIPKAKLGTDFSLALSADGDPTVFDFNLDLFKDATSTNMVQLVKYTS